MRIASALMCGLVAVSCGNLDSSTSAPSAAEAPPIEAASLQEPFGLFEPSVDEIDPAAATDPAASPFTEQDVVAAVNAIASNSTARPFSLEVREVVANVGRETTTPDDLFEISTLVVGSPDTPVRYYDFDAADVSAAWLAIFIQATKDVQDEIAAGGDPEELYMDLGVSIGAGSSSVPRTLIVAGDTVYRPSTQALQAENATINAFISLRPDSFPADMAPDHFEINPTPTMVGTWVEIDNQEPAQFEHYSPATTPMVIADFLQTKAANGTPSITYLDTIDGVARYQFGDRAIVGLNELGEVVLAVDQDRSTTFTVAWDTLAHPLAVPTAEERVSARDLGAMTQIDADCLASALTTTDGVRYRGMYNIGTEQDGWQDCEAIGND